MQHGCSIGPTLKWRAVSGLQLPAAEVTRHYTDSSNVCLHEPLLSEAQPPYACAPQQTGAAGTCKKTATTSQLTRNATP